MSMITSKDSFKRIDLEDLTLTASDNSSISWSSITGTPLKFVSVGTGGNVNAAISTDGITWQENTSAFLDNSPRVPVVANSDQTLFYTHSQFSQYTSTDGLTWLSSSVDGQINGATALSPIYADGKFVMVYENSGSPTLRYSTDTITWTYVTAPYGQFMAYGNGKFAYYSSFDSAIVTSTDAVTWTSTPFMTNSTWAKIKFMNNLFVRSGGNADWIEHSTDAVTWTSLQLPQVQYNSYGGVEYGNGFYLAIGYLGEVVKSTDLVNWTQIGYTGSGVVFSTDFRGGKFYVSNDDPSVYSSTDGLTWVQSAKPTSYMTLSSFGADLVESNLNITSSGISTTENISATNITATDITATNLIGDGSQITNLPAFSSLELQSGTPVSFFQAVSNDTYVKSSTDGTTWTNNTTAFNTSGQTFFVQNSDGTKIVAPGSGSTYVSTDGATWTSSMSQTGNPIDGLYANGRFFIIYSDTSYVSVSTDGTMWMDGSLGMGMPYGISYLNGEVFVNLSDGFVAKSTDGVMWNTTDAGLLNYVSLDSVNDTLISLQGASYTGKKSTDGTTWTDFSFNRMVSVGPGSNPIAYGNGVYVLANAEGYPMYSTDLISWSDGDQMISYDQVIFTEGYFYLLKDSDTLVYRSANGATWTSFITNKDYGTRLSVLGGIVNHSLSLTSTGIVTQDILTAKKFIGDGSLLTGISSGGGGTQKLYTEEFSVYTGYSWSTPYSWTVPEGVNRIAIKLVGGGGGGGTAEAMASIPNLTSSSAWNGGGSGGGVTWFTNPNLMMPYEAYGGDQGLYKWFNASGTYLPQSNPNTSSGSGSGMRQQTPQVPGRGGAGYVSNANASASYPDGSYSEAISVVEGGRGLDGKELYASFDVTPGDQWSLSIGEGGDWGSGPSGGQHGAVYITYVK